MTSSHYQHAYLLKVHHQPTRSTGAEQLLDSDGYIYSRKKSKDTALTSTWRCSKYNPPTKCKCHCYLSLSDHTLTLGSQPHNHSADGSAPARQEVLTSLKRKAADQPLSATQNLISETLADTTPAVNQTLPNLGFHRGFKTRVNRPKPSVQEYVRAVREEQVMTDYHLDRLSVGKTLSKRRRTCHTHLYRPGH